MSTQFCGGRPSLFIDVEDAVRLRQQVAQPGWKRDFYLNEEEDRTFLGFGGVKPNADRWLDRTVEIPERGGHYHHFFCDDGTRLDWPAENLACADGYSCPSCGRVYEGDKFDAAVRWHAHNELAVAAFDLGLAYRIEQDDRYARKAAEILTGYARAYPGPHTSGGEGGILLQSLCESVWAMPISGAYDLVCETLSDDERSAVEGMLRTVARGLMQCGVDGNWGSWHLSAVGTIGYAIRDEQLVDYGIREFDAQIRDQLGDDGLWPESVHTYHFYPLGAFVYFAEAAYNNGTNLFDRQPKPGKSLKLMFTAPLRYAYPDFRLAAINDGWFDSWLPLNLYELAYARTGDPELGWALKAGYETGKWKRGGLWGFLHGAELDPDIRRPAIGTTVFPNIGIAVLRGPASVMTFDYGPFLGHGQPDKMGITLWANDRLLVADYGTCGYGSPLLKWYVSTPAHNTVVVDGANQAGTTERNLTGAPDNGGGYEALVSETEQAYPGVLHTRTVARAGDDYMIVDELTSEEEHTYDWMLRCEGELKVYLPEWEEPIPLGYEFITDRAQHLAGSPWMACWESEGQGLAVAFADESLSVVTRCECPAETSARTVDLLVVRKRGKTARFTALLHPYRGEPKIDLGKWGQGKVVGG